MSGQLSCDGFSIFRPSRGSRASRAAGAVPSWAAGRGCRMLSATDAARTVTMTARLTGDGISGMLLLTSLWDA